MKMIALATSLLLAGVLAAPLALASDPDTDRSHPKAFVHDSVITTKIKSKLAAEHITSQQALDRAISIARETEGVKDVKSTLKIRQDD
jgi:hyperosmotically inducible protein